MKSQFAIFAVVAAHLSLAGCATSSQHAIQLMEPVKSNNLASLDFNFILVTTTTPSTDLQSETRLLQDSILSGLRETGAYARVEDSNTNAIPAGIKISASIREITRVSAASREWYGGLAGKAEVVVRVELSDLLTGKPVELFEVEGKTGASARAGTTDEAIEQAAAKVVAEVANLDSQAARQLIQQRQ